VRYRVETELQWDFAEPVREHHVQLRLAPWDEEWQKRGDCAIDIEPAAEPTRHRDGFGNPVHGFAVMAAHSSLSLKLSTMVETLLSNPFDYRAVTQSRELDWIQHSLKQAPRLWDFVLHRSPLTPGPADLTTDLELPERVADKPLIEQVQNAMSWVQDAFEFDPNRLQAQPELAAVLESRCGGSMDLAHLLIAVVRSWGVPARFAKGYVDADFFEPDEDEEEREPLPQSMRAWADVLIPGAGWRGFDPAEGLVVNETYLRVAVGRDAGDVPLERAAFKGGTEEPERRLLINVSQVE
jgi:transglutaminase-like putative cysteine protease